MIGGSAPQATASRPRPHGQGSCSPSVRFTGMRDGHAVYEAGSGRLTFRSTHR
ncbi:MULTISPECIES: hypothetical protein [Thermomonosporaceae]|uniref:hypothetical protein n=1 Tax=Thermomonosporaceae TaxID=2012 RepID=UPI00255AF183|nr:MULTISPECIES: hypothetical protein [Thermomonosporaceae]MDL4774416.1 hypothetical protein [Actinomadura xylanilytica]